MEIARRLFLGLKASHSRRRAVRIFVIFLTNSLFPAPAPSTSDSFLACDNLLLLSLRFLNTNTRP